MDLVATADQPTLKILYDSDFVIAESVDFSFTSLEYIHNVDYDGGYLSFTSWNNNTAAFFEVMEIRKGFEKQTTNFTIEIRSNYPKNYSPDYNHFCRANSSEALRGLIRTCRAGTLLREMNIQEQEQMRSFKAEQKSRCRL